MTTPSGNSIPTVAVWDDSSLADPHRDADKAGKVRDMFAAIAHRYDLNNRVHSFGRDQAWRRFAVRQAGVRDGDLVLDVACGTGDLTQAFAKTGAGAVVGIDFTRAMLDLATAKRARLPARECGRITYMEGDATDLPVADASVNVVSIAFGLRNVADPARAVAEFARVLKPCGRLVILEFARPRNALVRAVNGWYSGWLMPRTATLIAGDRSGAYRYLPRSVGTFMTGDQLCGLIRGCGLREVTATALTLGVCACYRAVKPA
ncbi:MAG: bifunctional demethylmenaquinone methyltransferase/2-methoxy-6-polyprenyl-1,4-benzoquinol methylase UbiE [Phycisphaerales bacterium]|nr:bifunctional demethylmenaquinone methyltransferase/2-methoxy-6-polyprenyl-1,4-benzoquinol methylase UbiE [Phycisphaerales bacterium]